MHLDLRHLRQQILHSKQLTNQVHSGKFGKARIVRSLITRVTYEKHASRFPDVVVVFILRVFFNSRYKNTVVSCILTGPTGSPKYSETTKISHCTTH